MKSALSRVENEDGFILITAMVILILLTFLGIFATNTAMFELQISGNDRVARETFYKADGGVQASIELVEQNLSCPGGFPDTLATIGGVDLFEPDFAYNILMVDVKGATNAVVLETVPSDTIRSIRLPDDPASRVDTAPRTNIAIWGQTKIMDGNGMEMIAGGEGRGKGAASGGTFIEYNIHSQHIGKVNSETKILANWRHINGQEGDCYY